jgi:inner membrane transporter RhtA
MLVISSIVSTQIGASVAIHLFTHIGPAGAVLLRLGFAALILLFALRPRLAGYTLAAYSSAILFGLTLAAMNITFYQALDRIPLGIAVTLEFVGPLAVAIAGSRNALDVLWVILAATGILLITPWGGLNLDLLGMALALIAGSLWAVYIILSARVGQEEFQGGSGLVIALLVAGAVTVPVGVVGAGASLLDPRVLAGGVVVALLSSVVTYSFELSALRAMSKRVFGVLMSLEPAIAAMVGLIFLNETLGVRAVIAIICVVTASAGASRFAPAGLPATVD